MKFSKTQLRVPGGSGHPRALFYLFFTEMWERFSFYGMRALLTLYMVEKLFVSLAQRDTISAIIYAAYGSLVYVTPVVGGRIADGVMGTRKSIVLGGVLMALGHFVLAIEHDIAFFMALAFLVLGNGFFKPNISTLVGKMYAPGDKKKDAGFMIFYMGINVGAMIAPIFCGYLGERFGWHYGFGLAGVGMVLGLIVFLVGVRRGVFHDQGLPPKNATKSNFAWVYGGSVLAVPLVAALIYYNKELDGRPVEVVFTILGILVAAYVVYILFSVSKEEREKLQALVVFIVFMTVFWGFFEMQGSSLTLFAQRNVDLNSAGINASQTNAINPLFIILFAIPISALWNYLSSKGKNPRTPYKFSLGFLLMGVAFYVLYASRHTANEGGLVSFHYLWVAYLLISVGELCMSPIGLSKATDLSPVRFASFVMGVWFLSSSYAFLVVGALGKYLAVEDIGEKFNAHEALDIYTGGFEWIAYVCLGVGLVVFLISPLVKRWMHGIH